MIDYTLIRLPISKPKRTLRPPIKLTSIADLRGFLLISLALIHPRVNKPRREEIIVEGMASLSGKRIIDETGMRPARK